MRGSYQGELADAGQFFPDRRGVLNPTDLFLLAFLFFHGFHKGILNVIGIEEGCIPRGAHEYFGVDILATIKEETIGFDGMKTASKRKYGPP